MRKVALALLASLPLAAGPEDSVLLRGGTVHPVSGPEIPNGAVLVRDGKIVEVGAKVAAPRGVRVVELKGLHLYPGLIDSATEIGLSEIGSVRETTDAYEIGDFNPQLRALIAVNPASEHIPVTRANGITSVMSTPGGGVICGQAALIHLDGWTWQEMGVVASAAMVLRFPIIGAGRSRGFEETPGGRTPFAEARRNYERRLRELDEFFERARRYQKAKAAGPVEKDLKMEAMLPVLEKKLPVVVVAQRERALREALKFAQKHQIRAVLAQADEAWKVAAELKAQNIPVILGPTLRLPLHEDDPYDKPVTQPGELHKAGVKIAFGTFSTSFSRNLPYQAANAVAYGLPYEEGLKAVTLNAAEIWGVGELLGSIQKGKLADLIVTDGDPLETRTQIKQMYIGGRAVDLDNKHLRLYKKYEGRQ
ncbi:MAG: amidohydrolase family protein [Acidobacteria bacterium]|nr:amidohydrolase family protein [Acidobacteriota bacterium]